MWVTPIREFSFSPATTGNGIKGPFKHTNAKPLENPWRGRYQMENPTLIPSSGLITTEICDVPAGPRFDYNITLVDPSGKAQIKDPGVMVVDGPVEGKP